MKKLNTRIILNINNYENRVAIIENSTLKEIFIERDNQKRVLGNIYKGKISRVLPGMQAAFVDIGLDKAGFLHLSEVIPLEKYENETNEIIKINQINEDIRKWLREGQEVLVQIVKESIGNKGAKLTSHLSVSSRFLVYIPDLDHIGVSLKIDNLEEKNRLIEIVKSINKQENPRGYILRTAAENATYNELDKDIIFLNNLWKDIIDTSSSVTKPGVVYEDLDAILKIINIYANDNLEKILIDNKQSFQQVYKFVDKFIPELKSKIELVTNVDLFEEYSINEQINKALEKNVFLKSGGHIVIEQTEAMITIDVNTGRYIGSKNLEKTIFKTNLEATKEIARQLRLRNLGGIIIIDFIDMLEDSHKEQVFDALVKELESDKAKTNVNKISSLGLVEMTRKRVYESLAQTLCKPCSHCDGVGKVKTLQTIIYEIFREIKTEARNYPNYNSFLIISNEEVIEYLQNEESIWLAELELEIQKNISLKIESSKIYNNYEIIPIN